MLVLRPVPQNLNSNQVGSLPTNRLSPDSDSRTASWLSSLTTTSSTRPADSRLALPMSVYLTCIDAVPSASDAVLSKLPITIGRGDEADICIRDTWSSRVHCKLSVRDQQLLLEDLGSSNGTLVNGAPMAEAVLQSGDQITVGITSFRVTYSRLPASREPIGTDELLAHS